MRGKVKQSSEDYLTALTCSIPDFDEMFAENLKFIQKRNKTKEKELVLYATSVRTWLHKWFFYNDQNREETNNFYIDIKEKLSPKKNDKVKSENTENMIINADDKNIIEENLAEDITTETSNIRDTDEINPDDKNKIDSKNTEDVTTETSNKRDRDEESPEKKTEKNKKNKT